jgi:hypothetical protein
MNDVFQAYYLPKDGKIAEILSAYYEKYGTPPQVLHCNKVDSVSIPNVEVLVEQWVLARNFFLEIVDPLEVKDV